MGVCIYSAMQFSGADVNIVSEMIKGNANFKKHLYTHICVCVYIYVYNFHGTLYKKDFQIY